MSAMYIWKIVDFFKWLFRFGKTVTPLIGSPKGQAPGSASLKETAEDFKMSPEILAMGEYSQLVRSMDLWRFKPVVPPKKHINYPLMVLEEPSADYNLFFGILVAVAVLVLGSLIVMMFRKKQRVRVNPVEQKPEYLLDLTPLRQEAECQTEPEPKSLQVPLSEEHPERIMHFLVYRLLSDEECTRKPPMDD